MGWDYALVHLRYTIPPALVLTLILAPLLTRVDVYKITFLVTVAVGWTIPWDSYLIHQSIWTYPPDSVLGPTLFRIPIEEVFFFVIQTYFTACLYILINKPTLVPIYLSSTSKRQSVRSTTRWSGQALIAGAILSHVWIVDNRGRYMRLILSWAGPVLFMLWTLAYQLLCGLPRTNVLLPILAPTLYLWVVDTMALRKGTWAISPGTKWDFQPWKGMEIEEAVFFLMTNTLVVFGLVAFDNAKAIVDVFTEQFPQAANVPTPLQLVQALLLPTSSYDAVRLQGLRDCLGVLRKKSRSFYLASSVFEGRLRIDLISLYAFCRVADDLVDNAVSNEEAKAAIDHLAHFIEVRSQSQTSSLQLDKESATALGVFPVQVQRALLQLPLSKLSQKPLFDLLDGFKTDLEFSGEGKNLPIKSQDDLAAYAYRVASTVAILCLDLVYFYYPTNSPVVKERCMKSAIAMGKALQYINIARDVVVDAQDGRCYLPAALLKQHGTNAATVIKFRGQLPAVTKVRLTLLEEAMRLYKENVSAIEDLPSQARGGIRVAVEAYVEIGRVMLRDGFTKVDAHDGKGRKATVSKWKRLALAWLGMAGVGRGRQPSR